MLCLSDILRLILSLPSCCAEHYDNIAGYYVGENADPIPDSNIGSRLLQSMGWSPGCGLGPEGGGITTPITAFKRLGRKGLGTPGPLASQSSNSTADKKS